jgi:DNA replication and repair protein RecF
MPFDSIRFASFRNLQDAQVNIAAERVFLVGDNGQGKTNFLEALYYLSLGSSFRGTADSEAVRQGEEAFWLSAVTSQGPGATMPPEELRVQWSHGQKEIRRAEKKIADRKELLELNPAVVFCHEDFSFANGEPERRRFFFDQTASLVSSGYVDTLRGYKRVLKQRNAALKDRRYDLLDLLDEQLVVFGLALMSERRRLEDELSPPFTELYERVSLLGRAVSLEYRPSWPRDALGGALGDVDALRARLEARRGDELAMGTSLSGPHRDRWSFIAEGRDFSAKASTGQLRLLSLVLRSVQASHYTKIVGRRPVLLLDDVLLELDPDKRKRFFECLPESSQAFFTFLPGEQLEDYRSRTGIVYRMEHGRLTD